MRANLFVVAALAGAALPGCVFREGHRESRVSAGASIEIEHSYVYYPSYHAYFCDSTDEWWVLEGSVWARSRERPSRVVIHEQTPWVVVSVRGPEPHVQYQDHARSYPEDWNPGKSKGPPPGRGWRK